MTVEHLGETVLLKIKQREKCLDCLITLLQAPMLNIVL